MNSGCSCSKDESIKTWNLNTGELISDIRQNTSILLSLSYKTVDNNTYIYCSSNSGEYKNI